MTKQARGGQFSAGTNTRFAVELLAGLLAFAPAAAQDERCKPVRDSWTWFSDHVVASVTYVIQGPQGRAYEVGTGIKAWGKPRGTTRSGSGKIEITAYGIGAIHVRMSDGKGAGTICVAEGDISTITFAEVEF